MSQIGPYDVAVLHWSERDGIAQVIEDELSTLGHHPFSVYFGELIPEKAQVVFTSGPYGSLYTFLSQLESWPRSKRPIVAHWNTEGMPDPFLPGAVVRLVSAGRAWLDRIRLRHQNLAYMRPLSLFDTRMLRYRYVGDYHYLYKKQCLHVLADSSAIYARIRTKQGLPTVYAPWGATPRWYANLGEERYIDVLWMGKRATKRRSDLLDQVRAGLKKEGIEVYVADDVENPFIFDDERTRFLNRTKITLNLTRTWYDDNFSRFALSAPNRSLVVSEPLLSHCPIVEPGLHYVSAPAERLVETILYYLKHQDERTQIVEKAYELVVNQLPFQQSVATVMSGVARWQ